MKRAPLITAATLLGMGMGGFADGILFHQLLQTHSMLSARVPRTTVVGLETNMFWDGVFHVGTWCMTVIGIAFLWHAVRLPQAHLTTKSLVGGLALGWGLFNLVEGTINHHILHLHHVTETQNHIMFDIAFLASGGLLVAIASLLIRSDRSHVIEMIGEIWPDSS
jgi:uncharacterized membrane protein